MEAASRAPVAPTEGRKERAAALAGLGAAGAYLWALDPASDGVWPPCPSRMLLGIDCPGCGGLRGTHDLLHGDVLSALDHNVLLPATLAVLAVMLGMWMLPLVGRPARRLHPPQWALVAAGVVVAAFTVLRNLPVPALEALGSG